MEGTRVEKERKVGEGRGGIVKGGDWALNEGDKEKDVKRRFREKERERKRAVKGWERGKWMEVETEGRGV